MGRGAGEPGDGRLGHPARPGPDRGAHAPGQPGQLLALEPLEPARAGGKPGPPWSPAPDRWTSWGTSPSRPPFRIGSNAGPFTLYLDGRWHRAPTALLRSQAPVTARVPETQRIRYEGGRYRFAGWSDGVETPERTIDPAAGGSLDVLLAAEWPLEIVRRPPHGGTVTADPPAEDWHYADGMETTVTATPAAGWEFAGWSGDVSGGSPATVQLDRPLAADAWFTRTRELRSGEPVAIASPSAHGYRFRAGTGPAELVLAFTPAPGSAPAALCVRALHGPLEHAAQSWDRLFSAGSIREQRRSEADFVAEAAVPGQAVTITISRERATRPWIRTRSTSSPWPTPGAAWPARSGWQRRARPCTPRPAARGRGPSPSWRMSARTRRPSRSS